MLNNLVTNNAPLNLIARKHNVVLSGDYNSTGTGLVDLKINSTNRICNSPIAPIYSGKTNQYQIKNNINEVIANLYPNSNNGNFNINLRLYTNSKVNINIFNTLGKLVYKTISNNEIQYMELPLLPKGVYIVKTFNDEIDQFFKFVKN